ncbi:hypothetical protein Adi01nite_51470 [Amorphoplanes digitatis]|nr:hypothetical protein Adi01nite_51470 [Actinoplanes digitatis]
MDEHGTYHFAASTEQPDFFGSRFPAPGVRVQFDPAALAALGPRRYWRSPYQSPWTRQGLAVFRAATAVTIWPCRLWRVHHLDSPDEGRELLSDQDIKTLSARWLAARTC